jgi:glucokinase
MNFIDDKRIVMTLDAGGTNLVFTALQGQKQIISEITLPSNADNLDRCISSIINGFEEVKKNLNQPPAAISFAFPGPADYLNGIIGDLPNLPAFRGGIALGPLLQEKFNLPVYINNDGDLFTFGEAIAGYLPYVNNLLEKSGSPKRYKNLLGLTLGTGFGAGIARDGNLFLGDNSIAGEIWLLRDVLNPSVNVEEHVSIRGLRKAYALEAGMDLEDSPSPFELYKIASGEQPGNKQAALEAFKKMAKTAGDAISNAITLVDGLVVIGGGLAGASDIFLPYLIDEMNSSYILPDGKKFKRLVANVYNLEDPEQLNRFLKGSAKEIPVYNTGKKIKYDPELRIGVGISKLGASRAIFIGAYAFALKMLDQKKAFN